MVAQRLAKGPRRLTHSIHNRWKNIVIVDEVWCFMSHVNGRRRIFYEFAEKRAREAGRKFVYRSIHVALCSSRESALLAPLPSVSSLPMQKSTPTPTSILKKFSSPFSKRTSPRLFGKDANFSVPHHDSARAHTAAATVQWLENFGHNFIPARNWPTDSLDLSPIDSSVKRIFKRRLWKRKAHNVKGLKRAMGHEWSKVSISVLKPFLPGNPVWNLQFRVMAFKLNTCRNFLNHFAGWKKRNKVGHKDVAHSL